MYYIKLKIEDLNLEQAFLAIDKSNISFLSRFCDKFSVNLQDSFGRTVLMYACYKGNKEVVKYLLNIPQIDVNRTDQLYWAAITFACNRKDVAIVSLLLCHPDIDPNIQNAYQFTPLIKSCEKDHDELVKLLLQHPKTDPNIQDDMGMTALMWAAYRGNRFIVQTILNHPNINPRIISKETGKSAFDYAQNKYVLELLRPFVVKKDPSFIPLKNASIEKKKNKFWNLSKKITRKVLEKIDSFLNSVQKKNIEMALWIHIKQFGYRTYYKTQELVLLRHQIGIQKKRLFLYDI